MSSAAFERWQEYVGDPEDLLRRLEAALRAADPKPYALSRAVIVSLVAAWETYVKTLARESVSYRLILEAASPGALETVETLVDGHKGGYNVPTPEQAQHLLQEAFEEDLWEIAGLTVGEAHSAFYETIRLRHQIAHGSGDMVDVTAEDAAERIALVEEVVIQLDNAAHAALTQLGAEPWEPLPTK
jgi:hypothetical protein